jgi:hypothetical protein
MLVLVWRHWLPLLLAVGFGASTLAAFVVSATVGLFGVHEVWTGGAVLTAAVSEVVAILCGGWALLHDHSRLWSGGQLQDRTTGHRADLY